MGGGGDDGDDGGGRNNDDDGILGGVVFLCVFDCWGFTSDDDSERVEGMYFVVSSVLDANS